MSIYASVVIPTLKRHTLLRKCLEALCAQSAAHDSYEIIVVTDGPDHRSLDTIREIASARKDLPRIRGVSLPCHRGPAAARNMGWQIAEGRLVIFTDDDCIPSPGFVQAYLDEFSREICKTVAFTGKVLVPVPEKPSDYERNIAQLEKASFITANCAISIDALELTGGFDEDFTMAWREDSAMEFCLMKKGVPIRYIAEAMVTHPVRPSGWGVSLRAEKKNMFNALLYRKYADLYDQKIRERPPVLYYAILVAAIGTLAAGYLPPAVGYASLLLWAGLTLLFVKKRLEGTSREPGHVLEMVLTSIAIPPLSVFWNFYGCIRFKSLLI